MQAKHCNTCVCFVFQCCFFSVSNFEILFSFVCPFVHFVVLCVCCSFCFVKYEYWQTTFLYNRAHRREMGKKNNERINRSVLRMKKNYVRAHIASHRPFHFFPSQFFHTALLVVMSANDENLYAIYWFVCHTYVTGRTETHSVIHTIEWGNKPLDFYNEHFVWCFIFSWVNSTGEREVISILTEAKCGWK